MGHVGGTVLRIPSTADRLVRLFRTDRERRSRVRCDSLSGNEARSVLQSVTYQIRLRRPGDGRGRKSAGKGIGWEGFNSGTGIEDSGPRGSGERPWRFRNDDSEEALVSRCLRLSRPLWTCGFLRTRAEKIRTGVVGHRGF